MVRAAERTYLLRHGSVAAESREDRSLSVIDADGRIQLPPGWKELFPASRAEIFGASIAFESPFKNIGMWHGSEDYAAWTLQTKQAGAYDVYIDYACANGSSGNSFRITVGSQSITGRVDATGADWSRYAQTRIGSVQLEAGRQRLSLRPNAALRGALMDLRTVALCPPGRTPDWPEGLLQEQRGDRRREKHARLAQSRDHRDGRDRHGPNGDPIGDEREHVNH